MDFGNSLSQYLYSDYLINNQFTQVSPNLELAYDFYVKHLLDSDRQLDPLLKVYNFKSQLPSWKWEMFAAILVGDVGSNNGKSKNGRGADLINHEVKSALNATRFEYQYHRKSWREKLAKETTIGHIYISYWPGYQDLDVRCVAGSDLQDFFKAWEPGIRAAYETPDGRPKERSRRYKKLPEGELPDPIREDERADDRARYAIPFKTVLDRGTLILKIREEKIVNMTQPWVI